MVILSGVGNLDRAVISFLGLKIGLKRIGKAWRENLLGDWNNPGELKSAHGILLRFTLTCTNVSNGAVK